MREMFRKPALCGHRRTALLSRRLWQPFGQFNAAAETHLRILWIDAAVHLLLGYYCEFTGTGLGAHGILIRIDRQKWGALWRQIFLLLQSAGGESPAWYSPQLPARNAENSQRLY